MGSGRLIHSRYSSPEVLILSTGFIILDGPQ